MNIPHWAKVLQTSKFYTEHDIVVNVLASLVLLAVIGLARRWYVNALPDSLSLDERRRRMISLRNRISVIAVVLLVSLWATELKTLAVSLLAIAVALVVATKEMLLAMIGGMTRAATKRYVIGDRIEVKGVRGDVVDITLMYTVVMELGPGHFTHQYTGKTIAFPNSALLTDAVIVDTVTQDHTLHNIQVPVYPKDGNPEVAVNTLQEIAERTCAPFQEHANAQVTKWERDTAINLPSSQPRVIIHVNDHGDWWLTLRCVLPIKERVRIEQCIVREYLSRLTPKEVKVEKEVAEVKAE